MVLLTDISTSARRGGVNEWSLIVWQLKGMNFLALFVKGSLEPAFNT